VTISEKKLHFSAEGYGAKGQHNYGFVLDLHSSLNPEVRFIMCAHTHTQNAWRLWSIYHISVCWLHRGLLIMPLTLEKIKCRLSYWTHSTCLLSYEHLVMWYELQRGCYCVTYVLRWTVFICNTFAEYVLLKKVKFVWIVYFINSAV